MKTICGANCEECSLYNNSCKGCINTNACPFGKKCWIAKYIEVGEQENFDKLKKDIIDEFNSLNIIGMPKVDELYPLQGSYVNLEYELPNKNKIKFLDDKEVYLGNQLECEFNDNEIKKYYGLVSNMSFILVCEYNENGENPELLVYKRRI